MKEDFVSEIDFSTLKLLSEEYIARQFRKRELDRIWEVRSRGVKLYFYILIEFQSTVDRYMSLRILNYITLFYLDLLKVEKELTKLPAIFPLVLYNGGRDWAAPLDFSELVNSPYASTRPYVPLFRYYCITEKDVPCEELVAHRSSVSIAFLVDTSDAVELRER